MSNWDLGEEFFFYLWFHVIEWENIGIFLRDDLGCWCVCSMLDVWLWFWMSLFYKFDFS